MQAANLVVAFERIDEVIQILDAYLGQMTYEVTCVMRELSMHVVLGHDAATELQKRHENHVNRLRRAGVGPRPVAADGDGVNVCGRDDLFSTVMSCGMRPRSQKEQPAEPKRPPRNVSGMSSGRASEKSSGGGSILSGIIPGF